MREITPDKASDWRASIVKTGLSEAAAKTHCGNVKTIFNDALTRKIITENPFLHLASGVTATKNDYYVTPEQCQKIEEACPTLEWKLIFGLARYASLRTPSETRLLTWRDVDWHRGRLTVRSPKTERYAGHEQRLVPITPKLMALLQDAFDAAEPGEEQIIKTSGGTGWVHSTMKNIIRAAGLVPWDDLFQTMRRSAEIEWAQTFPQYVVSRWIGHSITVSGRHYANSIPDSLFERAAGLKKEPEGVAQNPAQYTPESTGNSGKMELVGAGQKSENPAENPIKSGVCEVPDIWRRRDSNPRPEAG